MAIFDAYAHFAASPLSQGMAAPQSVIATMARYKIDATVLVSGLAACCDFVAGNEQLYSIVEGQANLYGYCTLNAGYPAESQEEQRKYLTRRNFVAALLFGRNGIPVNLSDAKEIINAQRRYTKPMAIHVPDAEAAHAAGAIAAEFPSMKFVFINMAGDDWRSAVAAAKQHVNIYLEISGSLDADKIAAATAVLTARKLLYGSGLPDGDPNLTIGLVEDAATLTPADRARIYSQNAQGLFLSTSQRDTE